VVRVRVKGHGLRDPRDKVYSILSIALGGQHEDLRPDYSLPVEEVYLKLAVHIIKRDNNLDLFGFCCAKQHFNHPSWVPDWSLQRFPHPFAKTKDIRPYGHSDPVYHASGDSTASLVFEHNNQHLIVQGIEVDVNY
jgi:hypothetical protein